MNDFLIRIRLNRDTSIDLDWNIRAIETAKGPLRPAFPEWAQCIGGDVEQEIPPEVFESVISQAVFPTRFARYRL